MPPGRFGLRKLAFTGPHVPAVELAFADGLTVVWGASNTGKSYAMKAMDFMTGGSGPLPDIEQARGYGRAWLELDLPESGPVTIARSIAKGNFALFRRHGVVGTGDKPDATLALKHDTKSSLSSYLLSELGIRRPVEIVATKAGVKHTFSFRHVAHYVLTGETDMMAEWSPARLAQKGSDTFDKNVLKFLLTGVDGSAVVGGMSPEAQRSANAGKIELLREMMGAAERELGRRFPAPADLVEQVAKLDKRIAGLQEELEGRQAGIDDLRRKRREAFDAALVADERRAELAIMLGRFESLLEIYTSDLARLAALEEAGAALLAGSRRPCPLCGADHAHQVRTHGYDEIAATQAAVKAEVAKIGVERRGLLGTMASLRGEHDSLATISARHANSVSELDGTLAEALPLEVENRDRYETLHEAREAAREGLAIVDRITDFRDRIAALERFRPTKPAVDAIEVGIGGTEGYALAKAVQAVLRAWHFPGSPDISFEPRTHDILLDGKGRASNGKGVRALMNAAFKIGVMERCRTEGLPHPGVLVLDSPLLAYKDDLNRTDQGVSADDQGIRNAGVHDYFYRDVLARSHDAQFIVMENVEPPSDLGLTATVVAFAGATGTGPRKGLF